MKIFTCNFTDFFCAYSKEIHQVFNNSELNTTNYNEANYIVTCLSDELNYPVYGNSSFAVANKSVGNFMSFVTGNFNLQENKKVVIFCHTPSFFIDNVITICYAKNDVDKNSIVICPPAIKTYTFNKNLNKKYFLSFKGNIYASTHRMRILEKFKKYNTDKNIILDRSDDIYDYDDLMTNSLFGIVVEGDLPWSYRFTECINSGMIPIIIKPQNQNIFPFQELIDYSSFSFIVHENEIDNLMIRVLPNLSMKKIEDMLLQLEIVNKKYFITRKQQIEGVLEVLEKRFYSS